MAETSSQQSSLKQFLAVSSPHPNPSLKHRFVTLSLAAVESTTSPPPSEEHHQNTTTTVIQTLYDRTRNHRPNSLSAF